MASYSTFDAFKHISNAGEFYELSDTELKQLQIVLIDMLGDISSVCERHGIDWSLAYGSCLGAVRHEGFIPWDDDLDIAMFRREYERFKLVFDEELSDKYTLQDPERTDDYDLAFPRIRKRGTVLKCRDDFFSLSSDCGVYIDLLIWDDVPDNKILRGLHGFVSLGLGFAYSCRRFAKYGEYYNQMVHEDSAVLRVFRHKEHIGKALSFASVNAWTKLWYRWNSLVRTGATECVSIPSGRKHYFGEVIPRSELVPTALAPFGLLVARIPSKWDSYLSGVYGADYMTPPPVDQREKHVVLEFDLGGTSTDEPRD